MSRKVNQITAEELEKLLKCNQETGELIWKISVAKNVKLGDIAGSLQKSGYIRIRIQGRYYLAHRLVWLYHNREFPNGMLDHINGNRSDNRLENLRECTRSENMMNRKCNTNNISRCKGVSWNIGVNKYQATIGLNNKQKHLGYFLTKEEASEVYNNFAKIYYGKFYRDTGREIENEAKETS